MHIAGNTYQEMYSGFRWDLPERFNVAEACCFRHAAGDLRDAPALIFERTGGDVDTWSYARLANASCRAANALKHLGVARGDIVAVHLPQCPEAVIAHMAIQTLGAIALPLFALFGPDAMTFRLADSRTVVLITSTPGLERIGDATAEQPALKAVLSVDGENDTAQAFWPLLDAASPDATPLATATTDPAFLLYTSGTTGNPKGVLHAQSVLLGHLPGIILPHEMFPRPGDRFWTPADWAWAGGLFDALLPALYFGVPVVGRQDTRFDPEGAFDIMARLDVRNAFMPPTALRLMTKVAAPRDRFATKMRSIGSGGEALGAETIAWGKEAFGLTINEFYGQTEVNLVTGNCASLFPVRPGSMGRAIPGHQVAVVDLEGNPVPDGEDGIVAVKRPNPVMFLEYWNNPQATEDKFAGDWCLLGDIASRDAQGYFWFRGRDDDIIISAGYRIGPTEVEDCIARHPDVKLAGVIGTPDEVRGEVITAFVVPADGITGTDELAAAIQDFVRERLAAHEYPRNVRFIDAMPMTLTGKIRRRDLRALATEPR